MQQSVTSSSPSGGGTTEQARDKAQQATEQAREAAQQATEQARGRVQQELDTRSTKVGEQIGSTADDLRTVGKELRNQGQETPAKVAEQVAERAERVAGYLRDADGNKILSDVEGFARRQPWAVVAGGLLAGFAASRFLEASSSER